MTTASQGESAVGLPLRGDREAERVSRQLSDDALLRALLAAADCTLLVLDSDRRIIASNAKSGLSERALRLRPGEAIGCLRSCETAGGCGAAPGCSECGALRAIVRCQAAGETVEDECRLLVDGVDGLHTLEYSVRASAAQVGQERLVVLSMRDISAEKRRHALERIFFHDVLNTIGGLLGWAERLTRADADAKTRKAAERVRHLGRLLEREVKDQRTLAAAEDGSLAPERRAVAVAELFVSLETLFAEHPAARERILEFELPAPEISAFDSDPVLLARVLSNMILNALEATDAGGRVRVWTTVEGEAGERHLVFRVHNPAAMPPPVARHVFERSFSTKASNGRGLGTWSMKLIGERYLGGKVTFRTAPGDGTVFSVSLPAPVLPGRLTGL